MEIRQIAISTDNRHLVFGAFEKGVEVWDVCTGVRVSAFDTILDFGGERLAIDKDAEILVAAAYERHGIAGYSAQRGTLLWQRRDLKKAQLISTSPRSNRVYAGFEEGPGYVLDSKTGQTLSKHRGVRHFVESYYEPLIFMGAAHPVVLHPESGAKVMSVPPYSSAFISVAFAPGKIALSGMGGSVRCFELGSGRLVWRFNPQPGVHCLNMVYSIQSDAFFGILWPFQTGGDMELVRFDDNGEANLIANIGQPAEAAFDQVSATLVTSDRELVDPTGAVRRLGCN